MLAHPGPLAQNLQHWAASAYLVAMVETPADAAHGPSDEDGVLALCLTQPLAPADAAAARSAVLLRACPELAAPPLARLTLHHFVGGPVSPADAMALALWPRPPESRPPNVSLIRTEESGATWAVGSPRQIALELARQIPEGALAMQIYWGSAGWTRVQLLGEMARGSWGLCAAQGEDVFAARGAHPATVYSAILAANRPVYAPQSEMTRHG